MRERLRKVGRHAARFFAPVALTVTFTASFAAGIVLHLPLPPSKRFATRLVTEQVSQAIRGSIELEGIERLHLRGVEAKGVTIRDPDGHAVLHAPVLRARANLVGIGLSALPWSDTVRIPVTWIRADHVDVVFRQDADGEVTLGTTFLPPPKPPEPKPAKPPKPARPVVLDLHNIEIGTIAASGRLGGLSPVDWQARTVRGLVHVGPGGTRIDTASFPLVFSRILDRPIQTTVDYHFRSPARMWTSVVARYDDVLLSGQVQLEQSKLLVDLDLPRTAGAAFAPYLPEQVAMLDALEGKIRAHGDLPVLQTTVRVASEAGLIEGKGQVRLAPEFRTDFDVDVRRLDLARVVKEAPQTDLHADARVRVRLDDEGKPSLRFTGGISPTTLYDVALPFMDVDALVDAKGVSGLAHLHEQGMPVRADFTVTETGKVRVSAVTNVPSLAAVPRLKDAVHGYAVGKLEGTFEQGEVDARVSITAGNVSREGIRMGAATVTAHTWGKPDDLRMDTVVTGRGVDLAGTKWGSLSLFLRGPVQSPAARLELDGNQMPRVTARAGLNLGSQPSVRDLEVKLERAGEQVEARSDRVELRDGVVDLGAVAVDGLGEPIDALARVGAQGFDVRVVSDGVDLDKVWRLLNLPGPGVAGTAAIDVDLRSVGDESSGCVQLDVRGGTLQTTVPVSEIDLSLRAMFAGRHVELDTAASVAGEREGDPVAARRIGACLPARPVREEGVAELRASASLALGGSPAQLDAWKEATGTARLVRMLVDLDRVDKMLAVPLKLMSVATGKPSPGFGGTVELNGDLVRDRPDAPPAWRLAASTRALEVELDRSEPSSAVTGADLFASVTMHRGGLFQSSMCVRDDLGAYDTRPCDPNEANVLASVGLLAELDYQRLYENPSEWKTILYEARMDGRVVVHDRPAEALLRPIPLKEPLPLEAERARAVVGFRGTVLAPHFDYQIQLARLGPHDAGWRAPTVVCAHGEYDGTRAWVHTDLRRLGGASEAPLDQQCVLSPGATRDAIGYVDADMQVAWDDVLSWGSLPKLPWVANANAVIHSFELSDVPVLADHGISGRARMVGGVRGLGVRPELDVQLSLERFRTGASVDYDQGHVRVHTDASGLDGSLALVDVDDRGRTASQVTLNVDTEQVRWEDGLIPTRDGSKPVDIEVVADRFKVGVLTPFVQPVLSYVDGELTGRAKASWSPEQGESRIEHLSFFLDRGAFQIPFIGQEFLEVKGILQAAQSDRIFVEHFRAQSLTGALEGRATIDLDDVDIKHVEASIWTPRDEQIRLTFQGIPVGDFYGAVYATIDPGEDQINARLAFDNVQIDLPKTDLRSVQQLDENPDITVVPSIQSVSGRSRKADSEDVAPWVVVLETRSPALLKRSDMYFSVITPAAESDKPVLVYPDRETGEASLEGYVLLYEGRVDVLGNYFYLEENNARVIFDGDPGDPKLSVTARWDAPDGTRVFADVTGPLRDPRIQFRSEPAMPQSEVLALVLFGPQTQGSGTTTAGSPDGGEGSAARDVGGGVASAGINMLLQDLSPVVSTRIDTSRGQSPSPTVVVQVSRDVTAEATYISEEASLDQSDRYLLTFDWRFARQWSLRITRGNAGTSILDVLWQHRY